jgi:hypothetical protein
VTSVSRRSERLLPMGAEDLDDDLPAVFVRLDLDVRIALRFMGRT